VGGQLLGEYSRDARAEGYRASYDESRGALEPSWEKLLSQEGLDPVEWRPA